MKILIISEVFWPENFLVNEIARSWKDDGHEVEVISQYPSYPESYVFEGYENKGYTIEDWNGILIYRFPFIEGYKNSKINKYRNYLFFVHGANKIVRKIGKKFDRVFVSQTGPLTVGLPAISLKKKFGTRIAIHTCDIWPDVLYSYGIPKKWPFTSIADIFVKYVYKYFDDILVSSDRFRDIIGKFTDNKIVYAPNWKNKEFGAKSSLQLKSDEFNFTFTGNISLAQNLLNVIKGFIKAAIPNCTLNIVGDGSAIEELRSYIEANSKNKIKLWGRYPSNEMQDILRQSNVCVISLRSGTAMELTEPFKLQDYLMSGKPIYGIIGGSAKEIIEQYGLGLCVNPSDINAIAQGFKDMLTFGKEKSENIAEKSNHLMATRFEKTQIIDVINRTIGL